MTDTTAPAVAGHPSTGSGQHPHTNYVKIWAILVALLIVSVTGPFIGIRTVTLITAFGIALVKAYMVCRYFMHINLEKKYIMYLVGSMLVIMFVMVGATAGDILNHKGANWTNTAAEAVVKYGMDHPPSEEHEGNEKHEGHEATEKDRAQTEGGGKDVPGHEAGLMPPEGIQKAPPLNPPPGK